MWRAQVLEAESRVEADKHIKYKGTARVRLKSLCFRSNEPHERDRENVERLKAIFRKECLRLDASNHVPAVIEEDTLAAAMQLSGITAEQLRGSAEGGFSELVFPAGSQLVCLHGQDRIQAAKELRLEWWTVDLYLADLHPSLRTYLAEEYTNEKKPSDGEIYRKIRQYHFQRNLRFERRWWNRLSTHGKRCLKQLFRHDELTAAFDALLAIPGLWGGMRISTLHTIIAMKCEDLLLHYLKHIKDVFYNLFQGDTDAMLLVNQEDVEAIELKAPRTSTVDAKVLRGQLLGGLIFSAFSDRARAEIWTGLQEVDGLVPSLFTFFRDVHYLEVLAGCMTRLTRLLPGDTVSTALARAFSDTTERTDRAVLQIAESSFISCPPRSVDPVDLGLRQLYAYAMRHYPQMPKSPDPSTRKELIMRPTTHADPTVLREFAELAERLGFESPDITHLMQHPRTRVPRDQTESPKPLLVKDGAGVKKKWRCGLPSIDEYPEDSKCFFIHHLQQRDEEQGEGITSFFVRKSVYSAFFGKSSPLSLEEVQPRDEAVQIVREQETQELARQELARQELARQEHARQELARQEHARQEQERQEQETQELARQELARQELARQELARQELARQELARQELARQELARQELARQKLAKQEQERQEQERQELERQKLARQELTRQEQEKQELERQELARQEQERLELARQEQERQEQERQEQERRELERQEQERQELERQEQERQEQERQEQERQEQERQEQERQEQERQEQERQEQERREQDEKEEQQARRVQVKKSRRLKPNKIVPRRSGKQAQEQRQIEGPQYPNLEDERRLEDQQRMGLDDLFDTEHNMEQQPERTLLVETSGAQPEGALSRKTVRITFMVHDRGIWKSASAHTIELSDSSAIEKVAMDWVRGKWRLFNADLRMLAPEQCYEAVVTDNTYTVFLMRESEISIDYELLLSAMKIGTESKEASCRLEPQEDFEEIL